MSFFDLEPVSWSSNYDDDEIEDAFIPKRNIEPIRFEPTESFKSSLDSNQKIQCERFIISLKPAASCFVHVQFPQKTFLADIILPEIDVTNARKHINRKTCKLYSVQENSFNTLLLITQYDVPIDRAFAFTQLVFSHIDAQSTYIFDTIMPVHLSYNKHVSIPSVFLLETEKAQLESSLDRPCKYLEPPALIENVTASLMSYNHVRGLKATAFISVEDPSLLEASTLVALEKPLEFALGSSLNVTGPSAYTQILNDLNSRVPNPLFT